MPSRRRAERPPPTVSVLRLGHRAGRDPRLTTHLALAARALGAQRLYLHPPDEALAERVHRVAKTWGGPFEVVGVSDWHRTVREFGGPVVHLTMYGEPLEARLPAMRGATELLLVVGGAKVPADIYRRSTWNVAVGPQPHSEVAALAVVLDRLLGTPGPGAWKGAERVVVPQVRGKKVRSGRRRSAA
ncbi:MAG TPA: tRNA (cytidine(56)-2'-O)-methyltransferase [Thermoplasmata archaeon]